MDPKKYVAVSGFYYCLALFLLLFSPLLVPCLWAVELMLRVEVDCHLVFPIALSVADTVEASMCDVLHPQNHVIILLILPNVV